MSRHECKDKMITIGICLWVTAIFLLTTIVFSNKATSGRNEIAKAGNSMDNKDVIYYSTNRNSEQTTAKAVLAMLIAIVGGSMVVAVLYCIAKQCYSSDDQQSQSRRQDRMRGVQEWRLERPVIAVSTVSRDYSVNRNTPTPSAPSSPIIAIEPTLEDNALPPEYLPPPSYNECVVNMDNNNHHDSPSSMTRIL